MKTVTKVPVISALATVAVLMCPAAAHADLDLGDVNSPVINQQQSIGVDDGWGGGNTLTLNSFNNVGGVH